MQKLLLAALLSLTPACVMADDVAEWQGSATAAALERHTTVATEEPSWQEIWTRIGQPAPHTLPADTVAVAVFVGQKRTGGYSVEFLDVREDAAKRVVTYRIKRPGFKDPVSQVLTSPYAVRLLPATGKPVTLEEVH